MLLKKSKKVLFGSIAGISIGAICILLFLFFQTDNTEPEITPQTKDKDKTEVNLQLNSQYIDSTTKVGEFAANGTLNDLSSEKMMLGMNTASYYIDNAITNPYFVTDYWGTKDNHADSSIEKYISPYLSTSFNEEFMKNAANYASPEAQTFFSNKIFIPSNELTLSPQCYDSWEPEYCFLTSPTISDMSYKGLSKDSVQVDATVEISTLYQKPDSPEGNLVSQDRVYKVTFILEETNSPVNNNTELPIMTISNITSSLDISEVSDYLINESN